jgi:hypothetical protein
VLNTEGSIKSHCSNHHKTLFDAPLAPGAPAAPAQLSAKQARAKHYNPPLQCTVAGCTTTKVLYSLDNLARHLHDDHQIMNVVQGLSTTTWEQAISTWEANNPGRQGDRYWL